MGRGSRDKPTNLDKKLFQIRRHLGVSQDGLARVLGLSARLTRNDISKYERGVEYWGVHRKVQKGIDIKFDSGSLVGQMNNGSQP